VGFMVIDKLASMEGIDCRKLEKSAAVGRGTIEGQEVSAGTNATT
jgi:PTH1 family peptidyl-tRNA hydrolase